MHRCYSLPRSPPPPPWHELRAAAVGGDSGCLVRRRRHNERVPSRRPGTERSSSCCWHHCSGPWVGPIRRPAGWEWHHSGPAHHRRCLAWSDPGPTRWWRHPGPDRLLRYHAGGYRCWVDRVPACRCRSSWRQGWWGPAGSCCCCCYCCCYCTPPGSLRTPPYKMTTVWMAFTTNSNLQTPVNWLDWWRFQFQLPKVADDKDCTTILVN